jgi:hypothetical protein
VEQIWTSGERNLVATMLMEEASPGTPSEGSLSEGRVDPIKLVVWDLDDTFWRGTLNEGPVVIDPAAAHAVRTLNRRGIINAICSKNEMSQVRAALDEVDLWSEFVFVRVDWTPRRPHRRGCPAPGGRRAVH